MMTIESLFQGIFTGFCTYIGIRTAKSTHSRVKKIKVSSFYKKLKRKLLK